MKNDVENLSETRVKFSVELPWDELTDEIDAAYRKIGSQVQIPGFRKGKVPRAIIDQRVGRGPVLEEVVNARVPKVYDEIVAEADIFVLGQPNVEITEIADGDKISFTAEVDIRPEFELPEYKGLEIEVDALDVTDEDVTEQVDSLRARFGSYTPAERATEADDVLLIDLKAEIDGKDLEELSQQALSYEVGKEGVVPGLDEAVMGLADGEAATFEFTPEFGEYEGRGINVSVTVKAVRERVLPDLDDELAMMASEFDTVDELITDIRDRLQRSRLMERGQLARNKAHDKLLDLIDIPVPDGVIEAELSEHFGDDHGDEDHRAETEANARKNLKGQFIFDKIADAEEITVGEAELSQWLMMQAPQYGMSADEFAKKLVEAGQVPTAVAEVRRGKALAVVLGAAAITDTNGEVVDLDELQRELIERASEMAGEGEDEAAAEELEADAEEAAVELQESSQEEEAEEASEPAPKPEA